MKTTRTILSILLLALVAAACSGDSTGPRNDDCPVLGSGSGTCS